MSMGTFGIANVYCDMTTANGGWIVIQRNRKDSSVSFIRNWKEYENGFGDLSTDFWYGLEAIYALTKSSQWEMRVDFQTQDGTLSYIHYNQFKVGSASEEYKLTVGGFTEGHGDYFTGGSQPLNGRMFSTEENDNDLWHSNCAVSFGSGWWFNQCFNINPNTQPPRYNHPNIALNIEIKIRPKNCVM